MMSSLAPTATAQSDNSFIHQRFAAHGFTPLSEMAFGERDVRRVLPIDPYGILPIPGIELERHHGGHLTLRAQFPGWTSLAYPLTQDEWDALAALEAKAFAPPVKGGVSGQPGVVVHCWSGLIEASPDRASSWWGCDAGSQAAQAYSIAVLDLAMRKMSCPAGNKGALWRFSECSSAAYEMDDPALQERFAGLGDIWNKQREPGADILAAARLALRAAENEKTPARLAEARTAVLAFGKQQEALRAIVQRSFSEFPSLANFGGRNAALLAGTRARWDEDIEAQTRNYVALLEKLSELLADTEPR